MLKKVTMSETEKSPSVISGQFAVFNLDLKS